MKVQFATYSVDSATASNNVYDSVKIEDEYHQTWHYVYYSYSHADGKAIGALSADMSTWSIEEFAVKHNDKGDMNGLKFFLGTSDAAQFPSINGYFYAPKLYTN